ncbi:hypothetical protein N7478_009665 [Penicillium angulare]|uniref:uncharacterized protein n=1 Tax=Penicillium angulare TaxID=116970 RepID=UPI00253F91C7|nr:uncharacterized protein N7478_009665 [Penicillium angulare]KAJ5266857.1 hypothetical protein N7478_009665 [Penicillium angulare]
MDGLRLNEAGEDAADDPVVVPAVAAVLALAEVVVVLTLMEAAAAVVLQCAHMKMLKPRPSQPLHFEPMILDRKVLTFYPFHALSLEVEHGSTSGHFRHNSGM